MQDIDIVFHTAALKHVALCEYNPFEAVKTNIIGTQNMAETAIKAGVEKVINISTDKAVNPINTMGATKLLAEKLTTHANDWTQTTTFSSIRLGNVLYSRGSILPIFENQTKNHQPLTITDKNMRLIVRLKLDRIVKRMQENRNIAFEYDDELIESIASRCTEVDSGARNVDHILTNTLLPEMSKELLTRR